MAIKVNFSNEEMESEPLSFEPVPTGNYIVAITEIEERKVKGEGKNTGKPYWNVQLTIQDEGDYYGKKLFSNIMLFEGALYSLAQILKATGYGDALRTGIVPEPEQLIGEKVSVYVKRMRDTYRENKEDDGQIYLKNEVKSYKALNDDDDAPF